MNSQFILLLVQPLVSMGHGLKFTFIGNVSSVPNTGVIIHLSTAQFQQDCNTPITALPIGCRSTPLNRDHAFLWLCASPTPSDAPKFQVSNQQLAQDADGKVSSALTITNCAGVFAAHKGSRCLSQFPYSKNMNRIIKHVWDSLSWQI